MAKSSELLALRGKIAGKSFYSMKGVEGTLVRSINEGLSNRVKNDAAFANTRLNAAEFGSAGNFAGALIRTVSRRWRYILKAFATAAMTKALREMIQLDATSNWGQRTAKIENWQDLVRQSLQMLVKNSYDESFANDINVGLVGPSGLQVSVTVAATDSSELVAKGADGVRYELYDQVAVVPLFDASSGKYTKSLGTDKLLGSADIEIGVGGTVTGADASKTSVNPNGSNSVLVVALPYRTVHNEKHILQELCSCKWVGYAGIQ